MNVVKRFIKAVQADLKNASDYYTEEYAYH